MAFSRGRTPNVLDRMVFLMVGAVVALVFFFVVSGATNNVFLGFAAMVVVLAFWIGTLQVIFRGRIP